MPRITYLLWLILPVFLQCKEETSGPEADCQLHDLYVLTDHTLDAAEVYDVRSDPPARIKNGSIEYKLSSQSFNHLNGHPIPYPCSMYFIDSVHFQNGDQAVVHIFESELSTLFDFDRDDCSIALTSFSGERHMELTHGGEEISEHRFAIYDHSSRNVIINMQPVVLDTFTFLEFRTGAFSSYEEIIRQFALEHPGQYDTVAIERVRNQSKE